MKIVDLTQLVDEKMSLFPGTPSPQIRQVTTVAEHGFRVSTIDTNYHLGTHLDVPAHVIETGATVDELELELFAGQAFLFDVEGVGTVIEAALLKEQAGNLAKADYAVLRTGRSRYWGSEEYLEPYPVLTLEAAQWLTEFARKGIGIDAISIDPIDSRDLPVHKLLLGAGLIVVENLTGLEVLPQSFEFMALPLKIAEADGSPVRAAALLR